MTEQYVCAFRGRRDAYQAPLALAEAGMLDQFITDAYAQRWVRLMARFAPGAVRAKVEFRSQPGIPVERVCCLWGTTALEHLRHRLGYAHTATFNELDPHFSRVAAHRATRTRSHLFLYSSYALEAFTARYPHAPRRILFQYHPHPALEARLLAEDKTWHLNFGQLPGDSHHGLANETAAQSDREAFRHADLIFCASGFTKRSLLEAGADEAKCRVVPYGIEVPAVAEGEPLQDAFHALFIGRGEQRKGLHHLLLAWSRASLPASSKLTLVCRTIHPKLERLAAGTPGVELLRGVNQGQLNRLCADHSLFVMPSLVEGFGQVYLEAMAQGCPVLGTANTCLPDLGGEADGIFLVTPGKIDELVAKLEYLAHFLPGRPELRRAARTCATRFTWQRFRESLRGALQN